MFPSRQRSCASQKYFLKTSEATHTSKTITVLVLAVVVFLKGCQSLASGRWEVILGKYRYEKSAKRFTVFSWSGNATLVIFP